MVFIAHTIDALANAHDTKHLIFGLVSFNPPFQGVCAMITPFNFPAAMITRKVSVPLLLLTTCCFKCHTYTTMQRNTAITIFILRLNTLCPSIAMSDILFYFIFNRWHRHWRLAVSVKALSL